PNTPDPYVHRVAANPAEYEHGFLLDPGAISLPEAAHAAALPVPNEIRSLVVSRPPDQSLLRQETSFHPEPIGLKWWPLPRQGRFFNEFGKLVWQKNERGQVRRWSYDASGNP